MKKISCAEAIELSIQVLSNAELERIQNAESEARVGIYKMEAGKHGFSGACRPGTHNNWSGQHTFSVGIFEWVPKASGGLKRSRVKVRVSGHTCNAEAVDRRAQEIVEALDTGTYYGPKYVRVSVMASSNANVYKYHNKEMSKTS